MSTPTWPVFGPVAHDDTHRLIPGCWDEEAERSLSDLADTDDELTDLIRLSAATNSRLQAQEEQHPAGLGRTDLVFGVAFSKIVNGAFAYGAQGARFHPRGPKGAWYCALDIDTCIEEVAHHRIVHLTETDAAHEAGVPYRLFLADVHAQDFALLDDAHPSSLECLDPDSYAAGQGLGLRLRAEGRGGVRYPSVRRRGGMCLAVLQAPIVSNVRREGTYSLTFKDFSLDSVTAAP